MSYKKLYADCLYCNCCDHMVYNASGYYDHRGMGYFCQTCENRTCPKYYCYCGSQMLQDYCDCNDIKKEKEEQ